LNKFININEQTKNNEISKDIKTEIEKMNINNVKIDHIIDQNNYKELIIDKLFEN
jgi:hypothetical protein